MSKLENFLNKKPNVISVGRPTEEKSVEQPSPTVKKPYVTPEIIFPKLDDTETYEGSQKGKLLQVNSARPHVVVKFSERYENIKKYGYQLPAERFEVPAWIKEFSEFKVKQYTEKQKEYQKNVVTNDDIRKTTPSVVKSNNPQGLRRYIFITELIACKNGFLLYTVPLIVSFIFLFINLTKYAFLENAAFSLFVLLNIIGLKKVIKADKSAFKKALLLLLITAIDVGLLVGGSYIPDFYDKIYIPFAIKILCIIFSVYCFGRFYVGFALVYAGDCKMDFGNTCQIKSGKPRCGKTSGAVHEGYILSKIKWNQLQYEYKSWHSREQEILKRNDKDELLEYHAIKRSYSFYIMSPCIPCLFSNICIEDDKCRKCFVLTLDHIRGTQSVPMYSVWVIDEIGAIIKAEWGLNKKDEERPYDISDMFRLSGHFLKLTIIGCEQDFHNIYVDTRRVVGFNQVISGQEWVCRPTTLYAIFKFIKFCISDRLDKKVTRSPRLMKCMDKYEKFVRSIGFRKYTYKFAQNTQTGANVMKSSQDVEMQTVGYERMRYVPSTLAAKYDDRAYKQLYPSYYDKEIHAELHSGLCINGADELKIRQYVNSTSAVDEKREAIYEQVKKIV